jgi:hypothetical protein
MRIDFVRWGWFPQVGSVNLPDGVDVADSSEQQDGVEGDTSE